MNITPKSMWIRKDFKCDVCGYGLRRPDYRVYITKGEKFCSPECRMEKVVATSLQRIEIKIYKEDTFSIICESILELRSTGSSKLQSLVDLVFCKLLVANISWFRANGSFWVELRNRLVRQALLPHSTVQQGVAFEYLDKIFGITSDQLLMA